MPRGEEDQHLCTKAVVPFLSQYEVDLLLGSRRVHTRWSAVSKVVSLMQDVTTGRSQYSLVWSCLWKSMLGGRSIFSALET